MSIFSNLDTSKYENQADSLGGGSYLLDSDIYPAVIKTVYITYSPNNAMMANLVAEVAGKEYKEQLCICKSNGESFFINARTGKRTTLPGLKTLNDICLCGIGKNLKDLDTQEKTVKVYDFNAKAEVPKSVPTITELAGAEVYLGILKCVVDKSAKDANGNYQPTGETREVNTIDRVFHFGTKKTVNEALSGSEATFFNKWEAKLKGTVRNKSKGAKETGKTGAPQKPTEKPKSLFQ